MIASSLSADAIIATSLAATGKKKGADSGIDGLIYFQDDKGLPKKIVVSVKAGENIGVAMIRDFAHVIDREKAALGLFSTLAEPTRAMKEEAAAFGFYESLGSTMFPKLQILTIKDCWREQFAPAIPT